MAGENRLGTSIAKTTTLLFVLQGVIFTVFAMLYAISLPTVGIFLGISLTIHTVILLCMLRVKHLFVYHSDSKPLEKINLPNVLSLFRVSSVPTITILLLSDRIGGMIYTLIPFIVAVFLTDLIDGYIARKRQEITTIGRYLDSSSDYFVIFALALILFWHGIIAAWFFFLLVLRLLTMAGGNVVVFLRYGSVDPKSSFLGKASVFAVMGLFALKVCEFALYASGTAFDRIDTLSAYIDDFNLMVAGVLVVSLIEKIAYVVSALHPSAGRP